MEPKYIDLDRDKWLKEMGFDKWLDTYSEKNHMLSGWLENDLYIDEVELPIELINSLIVEWLRVNHGIWIQVSISRYGMFYCNILQNQPTKNIDVPMSYEMICQLNDYNTPQEAYSAAFNYIKNNNLI
jgi:hypothetical protein